jgi:hypothetical protein
VLLQTGNRFADEEGEWRCYPAMDDPRQEACFMYRSEARRLDCGELDGEGGRVWVMCTCGAVINRRADDD